MLSRSGVQSGLVGVCSILTVSLLVASSAPACGPDLPFPGYWYQHAPDEPERFFSGELGVLGPEMSPIYLFIAYRHLTGLGLDDSSQASVRELLRATEPETWRYDVVRSWEDAVRKVTGRKPSSRFFRAQVSLFRPDGSYAGSFINCLADAFRTAAETLQERSDGLGEMSYPPGSEELAEWIEAQELVFGNCGQEKGSIPEALGPSASPLARADRAYQIAAAHFYAREYETAAKHFGRIAEDRSSPWSDLAAYLVARCHLRSTMVESGSREEKLARARRVLDGIVADPTRATMHEASRSLVEYIEIRLDPAGVRERLRGRLTAGRLESPLRQTLTDYLWLLNGIPGEEIAYQENLDRWLLLFRHHHDPTAAEHAFRIWDEETRTIESAKGRAGELWLAASLVLSSRVEPWSATAMAAAEEVSSESPLYLTVRYHLARLQQLSGRLEVARNGLERALDEVREHGSQGDRNRFRMRQAELAPTLEERIELGQMRPLTFSGMHRGSGDHALATGGPYFSPFAEGTLPADVAVNALNIASGTRLVRLLSGEDLDPTLRRRLAPILWTRLVMLGDEREALALEQVVKAEAPELGAELEAYRIAQTGEERLFVGALAILRFPGLRPTLRHGFGRYGVGESWWGDGEPPSLGDFSYLRDNWWCSDPLHGVESRFLSGLDQKARAEAEETIADLKGLPPAPTYLGQIVLGWAETHRSDARVPEALHRTVRGSRVCGGGEISRVAFQTLHRRYPRSEWAAKTKYWYE